MEIKSAEEILSESHPRTWQNTSAKDGKFYHHDSVIRAMKIYASQAVRMALEEAANNATVFRGVVYLVDKDSILSLEQSIIDKLK